MPTASQRAKFLVAAHPDVACMPERAVCQCRCPISRACQCRNGPQWRTQWESSGLQGARDDAFGVLVQSLRKIHRENKLRPPKKNNGWHVIFLGTRDSTQ